MGEKGAFVSRRISEVREVLLRTQTISDDFNSKIQPCTRHQTLWCAYAQLFIPAAGILWEKLCVQVLTEQMVNSFSDRFLCLHFAPQAAVQKPRRGALGWRSMRQPHYALEALHFPPFFG